jgi:preprotein translocase subunit SecG
MKIIQIVQLIIAISLMASILLQNRGSGLSGIFGGSDNVYRTKRGVEKFLFIATIVLGILFVVIALSGLLIQK